MISIQVSFIRFTLSNKIYAVNFIKIIKTMIHQVRFQVHQKSTLITL